jgi:hypothetical protein
MKIFLFASKDALEMTQGRKIYDLFCSSGFYETKAFLIHKPGNEKN